MAWPPTIPPNTRADATVELGAHPTDHNQTADALTALVAQTSRHAVRVYRTGAFTFSATPNTPINPFGYDTEAYDTENLYNPGTAQYTCPVAGLYEVIAQVSIQTSTTNISGAVTIMKNAVADTVGNSMFPTTSAMIVRAHNVLLCAANDKITVSVTTSLASAGGRNVATETWLTIKYEGAA